MFNQQKTRWMMLGWLGRCQHLTSMAAACNFLTKDKKHSIPFFTAEQENKLNQAARLIGEVLEEVKNQK